MFGNGKLKILERDDIVCLIQTYTLSFLCQKKGLKP